jgi:poly-beta-1,6-N-acetyl-D-glucosamine synthase
MGFLLIRQRRLAAYRLPDDDISGVDLPVSVIISARNEAENLTRFLPGILQQNYPSFEVIVVNDCSVDDSDLILQEMAKNHPHLKLVTVTEHRQFKTGKKFALTMGIKAARYDHLLFTDADCEPASPYWIARMASKFAPGIEVVLGYSPYSKRTGFINAFTRFETLRTAINYLSAAMARDAYMGIGRNLAYTKELFFRNKGFASHLHILAGDDDLFVNQNATAHNTAIEIHPDAFTYTESKRGVAAYFRQKKRHMGVGRLYRNKHRRLLTFDALTGSFFYIALVMCIFVPYDRQIGYAIVGGAFALRLIVQMVIYYKAAQKLTGTGLIWFMPFYDLLYFLFINIFGLIGTFTKTTQWK